MDIKQEIAIINVGFEHMNFEDPDHAKKFATKLLNLIESLCQEVQELRLENQQLKDEINRLKGEKGKPNIKGNKKSEQDKEPNNKDQSPMGRKAKKPWSKGSKLDKMKVDREETISYKGPLPPDAKHKGYRTVFVQNIKITSDNVKYQLERFYSPSEDKLYEAKLGSTPLESFGAELRTWVIYLYYECRVPENKLHKILTDQGILISKGKISNILIKNQEVFHQEKADIVKAGLASTSYHHIDDTGARVMGINHYFSVLCNEYYSAFFMNRRKDRLSVLQILSQGEALRHTINATTIKFLTEKRLPRHLLIGLQSRVWSQALEEKDLITQLKIVCPKIKSRYMKWVIEASAITCYQEKHSSEKIKMLLSDAAPQFSGITELNPLCWIHEDRHYKKLMPVLDLHKVQVKDFRSKIWDYYLNLKAYKRKPTGKVKKELEKEFDELFSTLTGYSALDNCISMTMGRKTSLLVVLDHPEVPLHNNPAELAVREYVIKRKISHQTRSPDGTKSWESFLTIKDTCRKLSVNFFLYLFDRISKSYQMTALASLIPKLQSL